MSGKTASKIVFMLEDIGALGGVQRHVFDSISQFNELGYEIEVLSRFSPSDPLPDLRANLICLYKPEYLEVRERGASGDAAAAEEVLALQHAAKGRLDSYLNQLSSSAIVIAVQYGMLYELDRAGWLDGERPFKVIGSYHSSYDYARASSYFNLLVSLLKKADAAVFLTENDRQNFEGMGIANTFTIANAVIKPPLLDSVLRGEHAVYLGRLDEEKGVEELVETWIQGLRDNPEMPKLYLYGTGSLEQKLRSRIQESGFYDSIQLKGKTSKPYQALASARIVVSCSPKEGFPMTLLEASAVGTPAVVYDAGPGTVELVEGLNTGRVVPQLERGRFTQAVLELCEDLDAWAWHSAKGEEASNVYSPQTIYRRWIELFEKVNLTEAVPPLNDPVRGDDFFKVEFILPEGHTFAGVNLLMDYVSFEERSFVALIKAFGENGEDISKTALDLPRSAALNGYFVNSPEIIFGEDEPLIDLPVRMKAAASRFEVRIERWGLKKYSPQDSVRNVFIHTTCNSMNFYIPVKLLGESEQ